MARAKVVLSRGVALLSIAALGGCVDPLAREASIDPSFGDAVAANKAMHIVDHWPRKSFDPRIPFDASASAPAANQNQAGAPPAVRAAASSPGQ